MRFPVALASSVPLYLAPMAGVSESPFRRLCRRFGADVVITEFLSAEGIRRENEATLSKLRFGADERPIGVQIFGSDPAAMGDAAALVTDIFAPDFIDINFGCPVKKVVKRNGGSGCLKDLTLVADIIRGVRARTHLPVTAKIRSGWNEETRDPVRIARVCEDAGAAVIALHARSRTQMYSGRANWDEIAAVVSAVRVPVLGNGDISCAADVVRMHEHTSCAGVMIGRGSFGQPWIFDQARALLDGSSRCPRRPPVDRALRNRARSRAHGGRVRARSARRGDRVPQAPRLVRERASGVRGAAQAAARGDVAHGSRGNFRRLPGDERARRRRRAAAHRAERGDARGVNLERTRALLDRVASGEIDSGEALRQLSLPDAESLSFATIDHHRALRQGFPEVVFAAGKTVEQVLTIASHLNRDGEGFLITRVQPEMWAPLAERFPEAELNQLGRVAYLASGSPP